MYLQYSLHPAKLRDLNLGPYTCMTIVSMGANGRERDLVGPGFVVERVCLYFSCRLNRRVESC